jgi:hypothetical protein
MTEYKFKNATVRIHGNEPAGLKEATEKYVKKVVMSKGIRKGKEK